MYWNEIETLRRRHGSLNVPIEHHPTIRYMVYNGYYKVMSNIPKMGHLPTPGSHIQCFVLIIPKAKATCSRDAGKSGCHEMSCTDFSDDSKVRFRVMR